MTTQRTPSFVESPEEVAYELRTHEAAMWTAGRLLIGIVAFAFAGLAFAYFYLRSANNLSLWRPHGVTAPTGTGAAIMAFTVAAAALCAYGFVQFRRGRRADWMVAGWVAVGAGVVVAGLQIWELTQLPFFPGSSGYASCFIGWGPMNAALVLTATYWLETTLAREARVHRGVAAVEGGAHTSQAPGARMLVAGLEGCAYYWGFTALVAVFFWVLFYVL